MLPFFTEILFKLGIKEYRFYCEKLTSCEENKKLIMDFYIEREKGIYDCPNTIVGLQQYLHKKVELVKSQIVTSRNNGSVATIDKNLKSHNVTSSWSEIRKLLYVFL